jgi:hypothetical protein
MAERRMFAKTIIDSDAFLEMPMSCQALYFHLCMRADDDGFINNPKKISRMIGSNEDEIKILLAKRFLIDFESGVIVIKHWRMHNYIAKDRYKETVYKNEKKQLEINDNGAYTECIQDVDTLLTQVSIGKGREGYNNNTKSHSPVGGDDNALVLHKPNSTIKKEPKRTEQEKLLFAQIWQQTINDHGIELIKTQSGREAKACWDLVDLSSKQFADMALDGVSSIIQSLLTKKRNDKTPGGFWRDKSPRPSTILAMWPQLLETIREQRLTPDQQALIDEVGALWDK